MMYLENKTETETFLLFSFYFPQSFVPKQIKYSICPAHLQSEHKYPLNKAMHMHICINKSHTAPHPTSLCPLKCNHFYELLKYISSGMWTSTCTTSQQSKDTCSAQGKKERKRAKRNY